MDVRQRWWVVPLLMVALVVVIGWRGEGTEAEADTCPALAGLRPVQVGAMVGVGVPAASGQGQDRLAAVSYTQTGYLYPDGELLTPLRGVIEPFAKGPLGIYWDDATRTLSLLGPADVLSVHFPAGKSVSERAILNGEAVPVRSVVCGDQFYLSGSHLADLLHLEISADGEEPIWLAPR